MIWGYEARLDAELCRGYEARRNRTGYGSSVWGRNDDVALSVHFPNLSATETLISPNS